MSEESRRGRAHAVTTRLRSGTPVALVALIAWTLFAFAGAYGWTLGPVLAAAAVLTMIVRPRIVGRHHRAVDVGLVAGCLATSAQLLPLPATWRSLIAPRAPDVERLLVVDEFVSPRPLSLDPSSTAWALATALAVLLVFWSARATFERDGGLRRVCRGICVVGLALAAIAFVQHARSPHLIYGFWPPITRTSNPTPHGPFVNRNDFATWLLLALPLVAGYGLARLQRRSRLRPIMPTLGAIEAVLDTWTVLIVGALTLMTAALVASLSRSGLAAALVAVCVTAVLGQRRIGARGMWALAAAPLGFALVGLSYTNLSALAFRLGDAVPTDVNDRLEIWQSAWPMARDFWMSGVGVGAFARGMLVYQQGSRELFFNHAHNDYLQWLAEGGLLVGVPLAWTIAAAARQMLVTLRADPSPVFWIRVGAVAGLAAVMAQSIWDTGLRMPANAVLCAIVAAVALHRAPDDHEDRPYRVTTSATNVAASSGDANRSRCRSHTACSTSPSV